MSRTLLIFLMAVISGNTAELRVVDAGSFSLYVKIGDGRRRVEWSSLEKAIPRIKENDPEDITITFPVDYPVIGDATVPWSKEWYRSELTRLATMPDGWALRSITIKESGN